jgi:hypothetical protein
LRRAFRNGSCKLWPFDMGVLLVVVPGRYFIPDAWEHSG